jgi:hypothetical protein
VKHAVLAGLPHCPRGSRSARRVGPTRHRMRPGLRGGRPAEAGAIESELMRSAAWSPLSRDVGSRGTARVNSRRCATAAPSLAPLVPSWDPRSCPLMRGVEPPHRPRLGRPPTFNLVQTHAWLLDLVVLDLDTSMSIQRICGYGNRVDGSAPTRPTVAMTRRSPQARTAVARLPVGRSVAGEEREEIHGQRTERLAPDYAGRTARPTRCSAGLLTFRRGNTRSVSLVLRSHEATWHRGPL